jgi:hypothetical protein
VKISPVFCLKSLFSGLILSVVFFPLMVGPLTPGFAQTTPTGKTIRSKTQRDPDAASEVLDNDAVVRMVRAKLSVTVILNAIRDNPGHYSVTANSLIRLSAAGVPQTVIEAMQTKSGGAKPPGKNLDPASVDSLKELSGWVTTARGDKLTGVPVVEASAEFPVEEGATVRVTASCHLDSLAQRLDTLPNQAANMMQGMMDSLSNDAPRIRSQQTSHLDARTLEFRFLYRPRAGSGLSLLSSPVAQTVTTGAFGNVEIVSAPASCVFMGLTIDGRSKEHIESDTCGVPNLASIDFPAMHAGDLTTSMTGGADQTPAAKFASGLMNQLTSAVDRTVAHMHEALESREILVGLPLTDGDSAVVGIDPQDPAFRRFAARCLETFPDPPKAEITAALGGNDSRVRALANASSSNAGSAPRSPSESVRPLAFGASQASLSSDLNLPLNNNAPAPAVKSPAALLAALDNSPWIADGQPNDKQIYVIAGPCCGYSQALYQESRELTSSVQFRWIEMAPTNKAKCLGYLGQSAASQDVNVLEEMYRTLAPPTPVSEAIRDNAIRLSVALEKALIPIILYLDPEHHAALNYPTVVWLSRDGVRVAERPSDISSILESVVARPDAPRSPSAVQNYVTMQYHFEPISPKFFVAKENGIRMYAAPDTKSQAVYALMKGRGFRGLHQVKINGEVWIEEGDPASWQPGLFVRQAEVHESEF